MFQIEDHTIQLEMYRNLFIRQIPMQRKSFHSLQFVLVIIVFFIGCSKNKEHIEKDSLPQGYSEAQFIADSIFLYDVAFPAYERGYLQLPNYDTMYYGALSGVEVALRMMAWRKDSLSVTSAGIIIMDTGFGQLFRGEYDSVTLWYDKALKIFDDYFGEGSIGTYACHIAYAAFYDQKQDYQKALDHGLKALHIANTLYGPDTRFPGSMHWNIGLIYENMEDYDNAAKHYLLSAKHFERLNQLSQTPRCYDRLGSFSLIKGEYDEAMHHYQRMLDIRRSIYPENDLQVISSLYRIASVHLAKGEWQVGEELIKTIPPMPSVNAIGRQYFNITSNYMDIGDIYFKAGRFDTAAEYYRKLLELETRYSGPHHPRTANAYSRLSKNWLGMTEPDSAIYYGHCALHSLYSQVDPDNPLSNPESQRVILGYDLPAALTRKAEGYYQRYILNKDRGDLEEARSLYKSAEAFVNRLRMEYAHDLSKQTLVEKALPIFTGGVRTATLLFDLTGNKVYLEDAFAFSERSKSMILQEARQTSKERKYQGIPAAWIEEGRNLKIDLAFYQKKYAEEEAKFDQQDSVRLTRYQSRIVELQQQKEHWENTVKQKWPSYFSLQHEPVIVELDGIQKRIDPGSCLIEYFMTDTSLYIFTLDQSGIHYSLRKNDAKLQSDLQEFRQLTSTVPRFNDDKELINDKFVALGHRLYLWLLEGVPGLNGKDKLVIIPDGMLALVPFSALLVDIPDKKGFRHWPWVLKKYQIQQEYSASLYLEERVKHRSGRSYLGFAPEYEGELLAMRGGADSILLSRAFGETGNRIPALQYNRDEVEAAAEAFSGKFHAGKEASERHFKEEAKKSRVLHLAMHALTDDENPAYSQLLFTRQEQDTVEDGQLHAYELYNMELKADLAILSACNTGTGKLLRGEGVMSLSRAFKYAGCPNIMMSLWSISDASTRDVVRLFVTALSKGAGKASALHSAQKAYLEDADESYTHPYYWAAFVLVGDDQPLELSSEWWIWVAAFIALIVILGKFQFWRSQG